MNAEYAKNCAPELLETFDSELFDSDDSSRDSNYEGDSDADIEENGGDDREEIVSGEDRDVHVEEPQSKEKTEKRSNLEVKKKSNIRRRAFIKNKIISAKTLGPACKKYLGSHLNLSKMYHLYRSECDANDIDEDAIAKEWIYAEIFNTEFNLSFKPPDNNTCDSYLVQLRDVQSVLEKIFVGDLKKIHTKEKLTKRTLWEIKLKV